MGKFSTYTFPDGGLYIGTLDENGLPHSVRASCVWPDGRSYLSMVLLCIMDIGGMENY